MDHLEQQSQKKQPIISFILIAILFSVISSIATYFIITDSGGIISPLGKSLSQIIPEEKPLEKYSFESLSRLKINSSSIVKEDVILESKDYTAYLFYILVEGKKVTGQLNIPKSSPPEKGYPIILMNRGFIDPESYQTGMGTKNAAGYFSSHGFITIAPDFLGFGGSDLEDIDPMAARIKKPLTPLTILASLSTLNEFTNPDTNNIFMWGHSNGGQISLSVLEIIGSSPNWNKSIPTSLWAPVTAAFPYSILHFTDDFDDGGKSLRKVLYNFELKYDTDNYSIHHYLDWINSPIQLHQGTADDLTPVEWSDRINKVLTEKGKQITYYKYNGADHNLKPDWNTVVARDLKFFQSYIE